MAESNLNSTFEAMTRAFDTLAPLRGSIGAALEGHWRRQGQILDSMEEFSRGWFARRHEAVDTAIDATRRMRNSASPVEIVREWQTWMAGSFGRIQADGLALQKHFMTVAELLAPTATTEPETEPAKAAPSVGGRAKAA